MANEQKPAYIDLTQVFYTYSKKKWSLGGVFTGGNGSCIRGTEDRPLTLNANEIESMRDANMSFSASPHIVTHITTKSGNAYNVEETVDQIKQKTAASVAAMKP